MASDRPSYSAEFFCPSATFKQNMAYFDKQNINGRGNSFIFEYFQKFALTQLLNLIILSEQDAVVRHYCYLDAPPYREFWNDQLTSGVAFQNLGVLDAKRLLPQTHVHSLDLIKGYYCYVNNNLLKAISYGSLHAGCVLLEEYTEQKTTLPFEEIEAHLKRLAILHLAPGELNLAKLYWHAGKYEQCFACITRASDLVKDSVNEIHNIRATPDEINKLIQEFQTLVEQQLAHNKKAMP